MKLSEIQDLIKFVAKSGVNEVELQTKDIKIVIKAPGAKGSIKQAEQPVVVQPVFSAPASIIPSHPATPPSTPAMETKTAETKDGDETKYITIKSPMIGTFYRASSPDKPPFINIGDEIKPGKVVCIIEAMKLFNEIESDITGKIVKVLANDSTPVEYDQPLFLVEPS